MSVSRDREVQTPAWDASWQYSAIDAPTNQDVLAYAERPRQKYLPWRIRDTPETDLWILRRIRDDLSPAFASLRMLDSAGDPRQLTAFVRWVDDLDFAFCGVSAWSLLPSESDAAWRDPRSAPRELVMVRRLAGGVACVAIARRDESGARWVRPAPLSAYAMSHHPEGSSLHPMGDPDHRVHVALHNVTHVTGWMPLPSSPRGLAGGRGLDSDWRPEDTAPVDVVVVARRAAGELGPRQPIVAKRRSFLVSYPGSPAATRWTTPDNDPVFWVDGWFPLPDRRSEKDDFYA